MWFFMLMPTYFLMVKPQAGVEMAFYIWIFFSVSAGGILYFRFAKGKWRGKRLIETASSVEDNTKASSLPGMHPIRDMPDEIMPSSLRKTSCPD